MNEEEIVFRARDGNIQAFADLIDFYTPVVRRFAFQLGNSYDDIDDITQEVFVRVYRFIHQFSQAKFTTWLYKITLNVTRDQARLKQRYLKKVMRLGKEKTSKARTIEDTMLRSEEDRILHESIQKLDEKYQVPIILFYFHDKSYEEIGEIVGITIGNVKTRLLRGKGQLKKMLEKVEKREGEHHG